MADWLAMTTSAFVANGVQHLGDLLLLFLSIETFRSIGRLNLVETDHDILEDTMNVRD